MNTVRITIDLPVDRLADLERFLLNEQPVPVPEVPAVVAEPRKPKRSTGAPKPEDKPSTPEPAVEAAEPSDEPSEPAAPEPEPVKVTKSMIRALGMEYTKAGRQVELAEVFAKFGASSLSKLEEKDFPEVYKLLGGK